MPSLILARHPQVNVSPGICYGRMDVELQHGWETFSDGLAMAMRAASCLTIYSSPAARCQAVALRLTLESKKPPCIDARLLEYDFGDWEGMAWSDVDRASLERWNQAPLAFSPPNGETGASLLQRVVDFWDDISTTREPICVISHGGPLRILSALASGQTPDLLDPSQPQGSIRIFTPRSTYLASDV
ncbi:histidine phosphatase family protein [Acetobacter sacchari]|uniref:Histidine phosphatase family protein n=1 Tax=Acetobacter sacchari TaxID=2661687 RepID=A0ABS3LTQ3_9PROT|nr:histidine phosphatase family protein [Acetobacter sacchari]MBO1359290.1 histidine phosphatase family protein [Acetobacter sacchari]